MVKRLRALGSFQTGLAIVVAASVLSAAAALAVVPTHGRAGRRLAVAMSFPRPGGDYRDATWRAGCPRGPGVCGTLRAAGRAAIVMVWVKQDRTGRYWDGHGYRSRRPRFGRARVARAPGRAPRNVAWWFYGLALPSHDGGYTVGVRAIERRVKAARIRLMGKVAFTVHTSVPAAPPITAGTPPTAAGGTAVPFSITGDATGPLYPGGPAQAIALTLQDLGGAAIRVTALTVRLRSSSLPPGCNPDWYQITQPHLPPTGIYVPAHGATTLAGAQVPAPSITMLPAAESQDACQGASLPLDYAGSAAS